MSQNPMTDERRIEVLSCLTTLLLGPFDVGISLVTNNNVTKMMFEMAASGVELSQMVAAEAIVQTASKRERCSTIIASGIPILKKLYDSPNDNIKARALVGLCKCAASSGSDASMKPMAEGATIKLALACKKFLLSNSRDPDIKRWAAEGLSYLSLDAEVKEFIVEDEALIRALVELAKRVGSLCVFGVASIFVNLTNSYEKPNPEPELVKLAKFSKHHVPEEHPKDAQSYVNRRIEMLVKEGATSACVAISTTDSVQCQELLASMCEIVMYRVIMRPNATNCNYEGKYNIILYKPLVNDSVTQNAERSWSKSTKGDKEQKTEGDKKERKALCAFTIAEKHRGVVVQEGGAKLLIKLATGHATEQGKIHAAHGIAKIGVTMNPEIAFPGQRCYEAVRPLVSLLSVNRTGLQNYEALLALTNLSSMSDSVRKRIFKDKSIPLIEEYWFMQDHAELRAAAAELLYNMLLCDDVYELVSTPGNDRLKLWLLYSAEEEDLRLARASTAGLWLLTRKPENCKRFISEVEKWADFFKDIITRDDTIIQQRGVAALANILESSIDVAASIVRTDLIDYLIVISKLEDKKRLESKKEALRAVQAAEKWELIKPSERELYERKHNISTIPEDA
uniref:UNC-45/Cro1/She4 central domain-containing protein n=1 Tax=Romanomermis culicivorax TaxID=13658 RepID=A0A915J2I0_ROMCU